MDLIYDGIEEDLLEGATGSDGPVDEDAFSFTLEDRTAKGVYLQYFLLYFF